MNKRTNNILPEGDIGVNLKAVISSMGLNQREFAELIGKKPTAISSFVKADAGCNPSNLVKDIISLGYNGNWFLTGKGEMKVAESGVQGEASVRYEQFGRALSEVLESFYPVLREGAREGGVTESKEDEPFVIPKPRDTPGPSPDISQEQYEELKNRRRSNASRSRIS